MLFCCGCGVDLSCGMIGLLELELDVDVDGLGGTYRNVTSGGSIG